jgi:single-strand DNA-binding protein
MARFTLATHERWTKDGNRTEHTEWHNIVMWRSLAEIAEKYVRKGSLLYIEGRLRTRSYDDKDGIKRFTIEIVADTMNFVGSKTDGSGQATTPSQQYADSPAIVADPPLDPAVDDDMPF